MSYFVRAGIWFVKGFREYTRSGYEAASAGFRREDLEGVDLSGKSAIVTGSNSGIGKETATALARMGAEVHLVCRNVARAEEARKEIVEVTGNKNVHCHKLDLAFLRDVASFAKSFVEEGKPLDILVNNAGCMVHTRDVDMDGLETNFATNTLGTYMLTVGLIPALRKSPKPRVIIVSSGGMLTEKLNYDDLQSERFWRFDGTSVYSQNKRQQVVMAEQLAKRYADVFFASMHPGWVDTNAVRVAMPAFYSWMKSVLRTPEQGADTVVWLCAADKALDAESGSFFQDRQPVPKHLPFAGTASTPEQEEQLMTALDELSRKFT